MKARIFTGLLAAMLVAGCEATTSATYTNSAGSLALSRDDALLYAVDQDNGILAVIDVQSEQKIAEVKVGREPTRVVVGPDDTLYVSNRGERTVAVVRRGDWASEPRKVSVEVEPVGLAVAPDNKTLYVVNSASLDSTEYGTLMAIDLPTLQPRWQLPVGREPRGIALIDNRTAVITLYKDGDLVKVDLTKPEVIQSGTELYARVNESKLDGRMAISGVSSFHSRAMPDVVTSPDGDRVYAPTMWAREDTITTRPTTAGGYYSNGGPCNIGGIATPGVVTFDADEGTPLVDDLTSCSFSTNSEGKDFPPSTLAPTVRGSGQAVQGPAAAVVDPTGSWLFVVNKETKNVAILPTSTRNDDDFRSSGSTVKALVEVGRGPDGIALTRDGKKAFVYSQFDHRVDVLVSTGSGSSQRVVNTLKPIVVAQQVLPADVVAGRNFFFDATDTRMSAAQTNVACSTCHLEGREDAHVWMFPDGPRQTPSLAGRALLSTAPYHWNGEFPTLNDFMDHTVKARMGGTGVNETTAMQIARYIDSLAAPDNPFRRDVPTDAQKRGAEVFKRAACDTCHIPSQNFTNNQSYDVGTFTSGDDRTKLTQGFNTPSLLTIARTAPYLHDGRAQTLKMRILDSKTSNLHGNTSGLTDAEVDDLVEYLKSL